MNNKIITVAVVVAVALAGIGVVAFKNKGGTANETMSAHNDTNSKATESSSDVQETNMITYKGFAVIQKSIKIKKGTTVTWTNEDSAKHDVTPDSETADFEASELFGKGETYSHTFNTVGTYAYHCSPHPYMKGTIEVTE